MILCVTAQVDSSLVATGLQLEFFKKPDSAVLMIADISITGYKKTKPYIIEREIPFKQGDYLTKKDILQKVILARQQIMNTSLFVDVTVYIAEEKNDLLFLNVEVKERWYLFPIPYFSLVDRNFNQWWVEQKRDFNRTNYGLKFMQENVSGRNDQLQAWFINGYSRQIALRYIQPFSDRSLKRGFNIGLGYSVQHELNYVSALNKQQFFKDDNNFIRKYFRVDASYLYRPAIKARHSFRIGYGFESIADTVVKLNPHYFNNGNNKLRYFEVGYSLEYYDVDYIPYPTTGFMGSFSFNKKGFSKDFNLWSLGWQFTYTKPLLKNTLIQFQGAGSLSLPFNQPYYAQRLFGYGDLYMRGLEYYVVDGVFGAMARATLKQKILDFKVKLPIRSKAHNVIPFRFFLKTYGDVGYAYSRNPGNSMLNSKLLRTGGFGLDIVTFYDIVLKFEYSYNQLGDKGFFFHTRSDF